MHRIPRWIKNPLTKREITKQLQFTKLFNRKARKLAQEMGMDRYRWFRNVEVAAFRAAGQETVQYVSNINKYCVLFKLYEETEKLRESSKQRSLAKRSESH